MRSVRLSVAHPRRSRLYMSSSAVCSLGARMMVFRGINWRTGLAGLRFSLSVRVELTNNNNNNNKTGHSVWKVRVRVHAKQTSVRIAFIAPCHALPQAEQQWYSAVYTRILPQYHCSVIYTRTSSAKYSHRRQCLFLDRAREIEASTNRSGRASLSLTRLLKPLLKIGRGHFS